MIRRRVTIRTPHGGHARPVAELVRLAGRHTTPVTLTTGDGRVADLASVLAVMELALEQGDEVTLAVADAPGAEDLLTEMVEVLEAF